MTTLASTSMLVNVRIGISDHETMTVELHKTNETCHLVVYESEHIRGTLASLSEGTHVPVEMVRAGSCSNIWKIVTLRNRRTPPADQSMRTAN